MGGTSFCCVQVAQLETCRLLTSRVQSALRVCPTGAALFIKPNVYKKNANLWADFHTHQGSVTGRRSHRLSSDPQNADEDKDTDDYDEQGTADSTFAADDSRTAGSSTTGPAW